MSEEALQTLPASPAAVGGDATAATPPAVGEPPASPPTGADEQAAPDAEKPPADAPKPEESAAKRFEAAKAAELRARRATEKAQAQIAEDRRRAQAELHQERQALEAERKSVAGQLAEWEQAQRDPLAWALSKVPEDQLASRFAALGSPEARKIRELEERLNADAKAREDAAKRAEEQAGEQSRHRAMVQFVGEITSDECPFLTHMYEAHEVPALVEQALRQHGPAFRREHGRAPTNAELRAYLEHDSQARYERAEARRKAAHESPPAPSNGAPESSDSKNRGSGPQAANGPGTLTNNHAAQAATGRSSRKTKEERRAELIAQLEADAAASRAGATR